MGMLYDYAKAGGGTLPAAAGEVRGSDVPVPAAALEAGDGHQAAEGFCPLSVFTNSRSCSFLDVHCRDCGFVGSFEDLRHVRCLLPAEGKR